MFSELFKIPKLWGCCLILIVITMVSWAGSSSVILTINGLPANIPAAVTLIHVDGSVRLYLYNSANINNLPSGNYKTMVTPVATNGLNYIPQASEIPFFLSENQSLNLTVNYLQDNTVQENVEGRSYFSNNNLSSTGIPGVRPLPFALGNIASPNLPNNQPIIPTRPTIPAPPIYTFPPQAPISQNPAIQNPVIQAPIQQNPSYQNPINQSPIHQQPSTGLPFQLPPATSLFSNYGSYEWQAAQRPALQQPEQPQFQRPPTSIFNFNFQRPIQQPIQPTQPIQPSQPTQPEVPNTYTYTRPNPLLPLPIPNQPVQTRPVPNQPIQQQPNYPQPPINQSPSQPTTTLPIGNNSANNTISGKVWQDRNRNRSFDPFESTVEGMRVYLDNNNNNQLDTNEPSTLTNPSGIYEFRNLTAGTYKVSQEMPVGWTNLYAGPAQQLGFAAQPQVIGGWDANINDFPFMTALVLNQTITTRNGQRFEAGTRWCGATLIASRWLITAAHCVHPNQNNLGFTLRPEMIGVISNQDYIPSQGVNPNSLVGIRRVITHPSFQGANYRNDIALLELSQALPQSRALLPNRRTAQQLTQVGNSGTVLGWGSTTAPNAAGTNMQFPNQLQQTSLPFIDNNRCNQLLAGIFVSNDMICAGLPQGGRDACLGDSGGPLLTQVQNSWALVGIVSFGEGCAEPGKPGVYTNLGNYFDNFINRYVLPEKSQSHPVTFSGSANGQQRSVYFANFR